ncbi:MAG: iron ABC transporter permease [Neisseria sp.]|nr:iron ABC transporter permease [Neisseria sp.]
MPKPNLSLLPHRLWLAFAALMVVLPLSVLLLSFADIDRELWAHLWEYQLPLLLQHTLYMVLGVSAGVLLLGISTAWLTAMYDFPLRRWFFWALMLPLAIPAYVTAFSLLGVFDYGGVVNVWLRENLGFERGLPDIRNVYGTLIVLSLAFYPYVYLLARNAFSRMGTRATEVGASLGVSPFASFFRIALPMARPWIALGLMLALMETLADFGTVSVFNYDTFTTAIYQAWYGFYSIETAQQLASLLIVFVFVLMVLEQRSRLRQRYTAGGRDAPQQRKTLNGWKKYAATVYCLAILSLAVLIPLAQLLYWAWQSFGDEFNQNLWEHTLNSLLLGMMAAVCAGAAALLLAWSKRRLSNSRFARAAVGIATLGYGIPGAVLAVGIFIPTAAADTWLLQHFSWEEGTASILKGSVTVLVWVYVLRFLAVSFAATDAGLERISPAQEEAARSLGIAGFAVLWRVYLPQLKGALGTGMLMVLVDVMKEMPITLMMRPFDWDTLAVRIYNFTAEGHYQAAALPALLLVASGLLPVILFSKTEK